MRSRFWIGCFNRVPNHGRFDKIRAAFLKLAGFDIQGPVKIFSPLIISPKTRTQNIQLKGFLFINSHARFSAPGDTKIVLGKNCLIGPQVSFETVNHGLKYTGSSSRNANFGHILLEEGVWVGANCTILQNVTIKEGSVIAAMSLVNKDTAPNSVNAGIPAKPLKQLDSD